MDKELESCLELLCFLFTFRFLLMLSTCCSWLNTEQTSCVSKAAPTVRTNQQEVSVQLRSIVPEEETDGSSFSDTQDFYSGNTTGTFPVRHVYDHKVLVLRGTHQHTISANEGGGITWRGGGGGGTQAKFFFRKLMRPLVDESWEVTSESSFSSGSIFFASCFPSSTPHWS